MHTYTNSLINETSPYLLQHAHNPVNWLAWNQDALHQAKQENKLILVSIGYSACHWCHVMEHECFESEEVAEVMNRYFINIKVDREERPDIDMVYMTAVQLMTGQGGWPLNCFLLPDGRPIYGGTYFPKQQWINILMNLQEVYKNDPARVEEYAQKMQEGLKTTDLIKTPENTDLHEDLLHESVKRWKTRLDDTFGGPNHSPKFPLPNNYLFLLRYAHQYQDQIIEKHVQLTLQKMARGGIYDQLGGGFARYSVDSIWKVPHFEKMLYDNAQLVSLYCEAYKLHPHPLYKELIYDTLNFIERELLSPEGAFYSALDADSEGVEGKYYVWTKEELEEILQNQFPVFADFYQVNDTGYWEHDYYILMRTDHENEVALKHHLSMDALHEKINLCKQKLLEQRQQRVRPGLDDKSLTSWNALMCKAYADAALTFGEEKFKKIALTNGEFIRSKLLQNNHSLFHSYKSGKSSISGFLEDYAFVIDAFIQLYITSQDETWLHQAKELTDYSLLHFYDPNSGLFFFTDDQDNPLIVRKKELSDNVIPASNSQMALNLYRLSHYFEHHQYLEIAQNMLKTQLDEWVRYGSGYSNWGLLLMNLVSPHFEVAIVGNSVNEKLLELQNSYLPNVIFAVSARASDLPLIKDRYVNEKTLLYVCKNRACLMPVETAKEALQQMI